MSKFFCTDQSFSFSRFIASSSSIASSSKIDSIVDFILALFICGLTSIFYFLFRFIERTSEKVLWATYIVLPKNDMKI